MHYFYVLLVIVRFQIGLCYPDLEVCKAFIDLAPPLFRFADVPKMTDAGTISLEIARRSGKYNLTINFEFLATPTEIQNNISYFCLGHARAEVRTQLNNSLHSLLFIKTNTEIPVGLLSIDTECWLHERRGFLPCSFVLLALDVMQTAVFRYSPLVEQFWIHLRDQDLFHLDWIHDIALSTRQGNIPSSWVAHLNVSSLTELLITDNTWGRPDKLLGPLPNLKSLYLLNNNIEMLPNNTFQNLPGVERVHLSRNNLRTLPFGMSRVKYFDISSQSTNLSISIDEILTLTNMEYLVINTRIDANIGTFFLLPHLNTFICRGCWVKEIPSHTEHFRKSDSLHQLDLSCNNLTTLPSTVFRNLTYLCFLSLDNNLFQDCPCNALSSLGNLRRLKLSRNNIIVINSRCFSGLHNLTELDLSWNKLTVLDNSTFESITRLMYLNLTHNYLSNIHANALLPLIQLIHLNISFNQLAETPKLKDVGLEELDLSHNLLTSVTDLTMLVKYIRHLDLSSNNISELEYERVSILNLSYNSMTYIPEYMWRYFENLTLLDLGMNDFNCCHENFTFLQEKINASKGLVRNLNSTAPLSCFPNAQSASYLLATFSRNGTVCSVPMRSLALVLGAPLGVLSVIFVLLVAGIYYYRFEFTYIRFFLRMKKQGLLKDEVESGGCVYDAFVCYSGKSYKWISNQLIPNLETGPQGYRLCLHDRDFTLGAAIDKNIIESLKKSRKVIFVLTKEFLGSTWCQWELSMASHKMFKEERNYIILIELERLDHDKLTTDLEYLMDSRTYLEWPQDPEDEHRIQRCWQRLRHALGDSVLKRTGKKPHKCSVLEA